MKITVETFTVRKKFALKISRGTTSKSTNIWLRLKQEGVEGWGEASPFSIIESQTKDISDRLLVELTAIIPQLEPYHPLQRQEIGIKLQQANISTAAQAAIDMALYDWLGKKAGLPLWQIWGLNRDRIVPISVTIGISSPEEAIKRLKAWQDTLDVKTIKLKLGSPEGIAADRAMLEAIRAFAPETNLMIDANGGWNFDDAVAMAEWLAQQGVEYIEQPLAVADDGKLKALSERSPLPIFVDESCFNSADVLRLATSVAGVNLKIMKTGGLTEVMQAIKIARACNLKIMFGCYSDSSLANTAMAHLAAYADYLDLDSHLNLIDDPFTGAAIEGGRLLPNNRSGLGVKHHADG
ncbi:dipeptide epimerase [Waterburya agarophytonicola K14]|uniref:Dipeptide epimerase n=1 Tax=Waterburya agarophytonicola KI4 TaxID=2874699 RepID=A0A964BSD1_9CYAN|nr:dipeptide epimerase [Waterburya agarophytonicola]MCC0176975.1 dipeptide epimerase [Waterburya agarophytonicola KI4]